MTSSFNEGGASKAPTGADAGAGYGDDPSRLTAAGDYSTQGAGYTGTDGASKVLSPEDESYVRFKQEDRSLGEIAADLLDDATTLVKQEVELAKAEAKQSAARAGKGVGLLAGAGVAALMMLIALTLALWWALSVLIGSQADPALGWGGLATAVVWAVVAGILAMMGKKALDKIKGLEKTTETVSKIPNAATGHEEKNR